MKKIQSKIKEAYRETNKKSIALYFTLRGLVLICMVLEILRGEWGNAALCVLSLGLFIIPFFIQKHFKITLPSVLESIVFLFIFSAEILGEIQNFYGIFPYWDTILHTLNGFLAAGIGFALIDLLNKHSSSVKLSPLFVAIVSFCFSMTVGVCWEFFEFGCDQFIKVDMQKDRIVQNFSSVILDPNKSNTPISIDNIEYTIIYSKDQNNEIIETKINGGYLDIGIIDTMKDLLVNFVGAITFSTLGYFYILNRDKYRFVRNFIPVKNKKTT